MARKGALMIEGEKNGQKFQVIGTHLNAGGPIEVRHSQVTQIRRITRSLYEKGCSAIYLWRYEYA
ncbi:MAG: hypothetical protein R2728_16440 [Chitinophagales bacterium]